MIVDTPDCCENCLCLGGFTLAYAMCRVKGKIIKDSFSKPRWCPLIPLNPKGIKK
nr:MAG TPA: Specific abundant protein [Caudoviricetes sp.]